MAIHDESYDLDMLSCFELDILKHYSYKSDDLIYFKDLDKNLVEGL